MLSGYRVFSRRFVKSFPAVSREFEIETELTVHSLALRIPSASVQVDFRDRPAGSESKLRTYRDGWKILNVILNLTRHERPLTFFGSSRSCRGCRRDPHEACGHRVLRTVWSHAFPHSLFRRSCSSWPALQSSRASSWTGLESPVTRTVGWLTCVTAR